MQPGMGGMQSGGSLGMGAPGGGMQPGMSGMQPGGGVGMAPGGGMQPSVMQPGPAGGAEGMGGAGGAAPFGVGGMDPFLTGVAGNMLRQQGQSYLQRGQAFMQASCGDKPGTCDPRMSARVWPFVGHAGLCGVAVTSRCFQTIRVCRTVAAATYTAVENVTLTALYPLSLVPYACSQKWDFCQEAACTTTSASPQSTVRVGQARAAAHRVLPF